MDRKTEKKVVGLIERFLRRQRFSESDGHVEAGDVQEFLLSEKIKASLRQIHELMGQLIEDDNAKKMVVSKSGEELFYDCDQNVVDSSGLVQKTFKFLYAWKCSSAEVAGPEEVRDFFGKVTASSRVRDSLEMEVIRSYEDACRHLHPQVIFRVGNAFVRLSVPSQDLPLSISVGRHSKPNTEHQHSGELTFRENERTCRVVVKLNTITRFENDGSQGHYGFRLSQTGSEIFVKNFGKKNPAMGKTLTEKELKNVLCAEAGDDETRPVRSLELMEIELERSLLPIPEGEFSNLKLPALIYVKGFHAVVMHPKEGSLLDGRA